MVGLEVSENQLVVSWGWPLTPKLWLSILLFRLSKNSALWSGRSMRGFSVSVGFRRFPSVFVMAGGGGLGAGAKY